MSRLGEVVVLSNVQKTTAVKENEKKKSRNIFQTKEDDISPETDLEEMERKSFT